MKKYRVTDNNVQSEAAKVGLGIKGFTNPDDGLESADPSHLAEEPVLFDPSTTVWHFPSGEGFLCMLYAGDLNPGQTPLPMTVESLDDFADE